MIIYNVTLKVAYDVVEEWLRWMQEEHMPELMSTGLFTERRLSKLLGHEEQDGATYIAQYLCKSMDDYDRYVAEYADGIREKSQQKFGNKYIAFRTLMEVVA